MRGRSFPPPASQTHYPVHPKKNATHFHDFMGAAKGTVVDHIDGDGLNNQRENLRFCTRAENFRNAGHRQTPGRTSQYKGVWRVKDRCRRCWRAGITAERVYRNIGTYWTEEEAARAYDEAGKVLHGDFARLNFPSRDPYNGARASHESPVVPPVAESEPRGRIRSVRKDGRARRRSGGSARSRRSGPKHAM